MKKLSIEEFTQSLTQDNFTPVNLSKNGECIECSSCCSIFTPISIEELKILKRLFTGKIIKNYVKILNENKEGFSATCPFSDFETKKCLIYNLRPSVCKTFHCDPKLVKPVEFLKGRKFIFNAVPNDSIVEMCQEIADKALEFRKNKGWK